MLINFDNQDIEYTYAVILKIRQRYLKVLCDVSFIEFGIEFNY